MDFGSSVKRILINYSRNYTNSIFYRWVSPTTANVFRSMEVILNCVLQIELEGMQFHPTAILGIICLILAVILMAREQKITKWHPCL